MKFLQPAFQHYDILMYAFKSYLCNEVINVIPFYTIRLFCYRWLGVKIGKHTSIGLHTVIVEPLKVSIGDNCSIGQYALLDGRGGLQIGNNVNIAGRACIYSATHSITSPLWEAVKATVVIEDDAWVASNAIVLPGKHIGRGAVVAAGAVLTKDVAAFDVVGGNPAKKIIDRHPKIEYKTNYFPYFH